MMKTTVSHVLVLTAMLAAFAAVAPAQSQSWDDIVATAKGQTVNWAMWGGFPATNAYVNGYVAPKVRELYGIKLRQTPVQDISQVVGKLLIEKQAGRKTGQTDLLWINGENFRTCKKQNLLFGPFAEMLPNSKYVDRTKPAVANDFGEPVAGYESPWGSAQFVMIYDSARTPYPPKSIDALLQWIRAHPGRFAYPAPPDFTGSAFIRHIFYHTAGDADQWQRGYDKVAFHNAAEKCYALLADLAPFLWRRGRTYPESPLRLSQLFADGEVDFSMSYHPAEASRAISDGLFPATVRTFVFDQGSLANTHYLAIPFNAQAKEAAMLVANFLLSPQAQLDKADPNVWGDLPVLDSERLDKNRQKAFAEQPRGIATLPDSVLKAHQWQEPASEILLQLERGWETRVLRKR